MESRRLVSIFKWQSYCDDNLWQKFLLCCKSGDWRGVWVDVRALAKKNIRLNNDIVIKTRDDPIETSRLPCHPDFVSKALDRSHKAFHGAELRQAADLFRLSRQLSQSGSHRSSRLKTKPSSPGERINITTINTRFISHRMMFFNFCEQKNFHNERGSRANFGKV